MAGCTRCFRTAVTMRRDGNDTIYNLFDTTDNNYYALTFGGDLLRYYVLNSESSESTQKTWMDKRSEPATGAVTPI